MKRTFNIDNAADKFIERSLLSKVLEFIENREIKTPILLFDIEKMLNNARLIGSGIDGSVIYYAVKANDNIEILRHLSKIGDRDPLGHRRLGFEIASDGELARLAELNVDSSRIITSNPVKTPTFIKKAHEYGVKYFAFDSEAEIDKLSRYAPNSNVYIRLIVPNEGSEWPLSKKFGVSSEQALSLLIKAKKRGLNPCGLTFHVGSQCTNIDNWEEALNKAYALWTKAIEAGIEMKCLNIGGGYPIVYTKTIVPISDIEYRINKQIKELFPSDIEIFIEPGRSMVGDAGVFVTSVIGNAQRADGPWCYIDVGVFNGLMESIGGIKYSYIYLSMEGEMSLLQRKSDEECRHNGSQKWTLTGPSCDSFDVIDNDVNLHDPQVGDLILILSAGAYTLSYASLFNGFPIPEMIFI